MLHRSLLVLISFLGLVNSWAQTTTDSTFHFQALPESHIVPLFTADSRAHRLSLQKPFGSNGYIGSMGGIFPALEVSAYGKTLQFSVASSLYTTLQRWTDHGILLNTDFFVDLFFDLKLNNHFALRSGMGHTSQHFSDDAIEAGYVPINYVRDYYELFAVYNHPAYRFMVYGGSIFNHNFKTTSDLSPKWTFQVGFEHSPLKFGQRNYLYWAADVKFRGEFDYGTTQNYQIGYKYGSADKRVFRFALNYSRGYDERGQFYTQKREFTTLGFFFDF